MIARDGVKARTAVGPSGFVLLPAVTLLMAAACGSARAAEGWLEQGPAVVSAEEQALQPEPEKGIEHGVILFVEYKDDEKDPRAIRLGMHLRAKIFSNEARDLGNIEIPYDAMKWEMKEWWGRVMQPDGTVLELAREELQEQTLSRSRGRDRVIRKGALPGIVPGSVIDYGYVLQQDNVRYLTPWWRYRLQWNWPVRELRYTWTPYEYLPNGFVTTRSRGLDVEAKRDFVHVRVVGRNLPPVREEPFMPPEDSVRAAAWFFYFDRDEKYKDFWNDKAKIVDSRASAFMNDDKAVGKLLAEIAPPEGADLQARLRHVYAWIVDNISIDETVYEENIGTLRGDWISKKRKDVADIAKLHEGAGVHRILLMLGLARELGAEADIVLATDRTESFWNRAVWTMSQLDEAFVAVRAPGEPLTSATLLAPHLDLPYGLVPYWIAGAEAMVATSAGFEVITPPSSAADENVSISSAKVSFDGESEPARVVWDREVTGQYALEQESVLKRATAGERQSRLEKICGKSSWYELDQARTAGAAEAPRVECEGLVPEVVPEAGVESLGFPLKGPWIAKVPELESRTRVNPLVFDFPFTDRTLLEIGAPPGFTPRGAPGPVVIDNPFGRYELKVSGTEGGYSVERVLRWPHLSLPASRNAGVRRFLQQVAEADAAVVYFDAGESE